MDTNWRLVALLYVAGLLAAGQFARVALTLDVLAVRYPGAGEALPFAVSALAIMGMVFGATAGALAARIGLRPVLIGGLAAAGALSFAQALLPPFPLLLGLRFLEGAAHLAIVVTAPTLLAGIAAPRHQPVVMGIWGTFFGVGFSLTAFFLPPLLAAGGAGAVFAAHGAAFLVLAGLLWPATPQFPAPAVLRESWLRSHLAIYLTPRVVAPAMGFFWHTLMFLGLLTYLPEFIGGWTAPLLPLLALVGTMTAGALARVVPPRRLLYGAYAATVVAAGVLAVVPEGLLVPAAFAFLVILGLAPGAAFAAVPAYNSDVVGRAGANGAIAQLGNVGTAVSVPLIALTLPFGLAGPLAAAAAISLVGWGVIVAVHRAMEAGARRSAA